MKYEVIFDNDGRIVGMSDPESGNSDLATIQFRPSKGERQHVLEIPSEFADKPLTELAELLRVNTSDAIPRLEART
jgi:hypothetical protein